MRKKKIELKCPICKKNVKMPEELKGFDGKMTKEFEAKLTELDDHINWVIELLNHEEAIDTITKRMTTLYLTIEKLLSSTFTTNYHRLGLLMSLVYKTNRNAELLKIDKIADMILEESDKKEKKTVSKYVM